MTTVRVHTQAGACREMHQNTESYAESTSRRAMYCARQYCVTRMSTCATITVIN
jgi:hypothetical protein